MDGDDDEPPETGLGKSGEYLRTYMSENNVSKEEALRRLQVGGGTYKGYTAAFKKLLRHWASKAECVLDPSKSLIDQFKDIVESAVSSGAGDLPE